MIIETKNLTKSFKVKIKKGPFRDALFPKFREFTAVEQINFEIGKGESVAFLGPNGAGKTTTMKMLTGLIYPTEGDLNVLGYFPFDRKREFLMRIGLVMGNKAGLDWDLTPRQSFGLHKKIYKIPDIRYKKRIGKLTELLDVTKFMDTQVRKLSLGERMKMELIGSILHDPEVLFLDEPTIGLDVIAKNKIREFLRELQRESDVTLLLTSHDMTDVEKVCDRVIIINEGRIIYDNELVKLQKEYADKKFIKFIFKKLPKREHLEKHGEVVGEGENYYTLEVDSDKVPDVLQKITTRYSLLDIDILGTPLDEVIADIFSSKS